MSRRWYLAADLINSSLVDSPVQRKDVRVVLIKANEEAEALGDGKVANNIILGALLALTGVVSMEAVEKSLQEVLPRRHHKMIPVNVKALQRGFELATADKNSASEIHVKGVGGSVKQSEVQPDRLIEEFLELVQVDSISGKERQLADLLIRKLTDLGLEVREDEAGSAVNSNTGNIIGRLPGSGRGPVIMLCAHMDTVEPGLGVKPVLADGVIRSAGDTVLGADDKAGIATILEVLRIVREHSFEHGGLEVVFTIWEEGGMFGAKNLQYNQLKARYGFVLDSDGVPGTIIQGAFPR